MLSRCILA